MRDSQIDVELGSIVREMYIDATPDIVYQVVSDPAHITQWWPDELTMNGTHVGAVGEIAFGASDDPNRNTEVLRIVEAVPGETFSFSWCHVDGDVAGPALLVTFVLTPSGDGTMVSMTETGFREMGWEAAVLEKEYHEHVDGWAYFLPRLVAYAATVGGTP